MSKKNRIRLYVSTPLKEGVRVELSENQAHYIRNVMRMKLSESVYVFDGVHGEFEARIVEISNKNIFLEVHSKTYDFEESPDIWLLFAPIKKENTDFIIQKAVELGVRKIVPVKTDYTQPFRFKQERVQMQIIEAAEQSRRQDLPDFSEDIAFAKMIKNWPEGRNLIYLDETGSGLTFGKQVSKLSAPTAIFIGPEGGFSKKELEILKKLSYTVGVSLPKRILRSETAAVAALACWQAFCGDWK